MSGRKKTKLAFMVFGGLILGSPHALAAEPSVKILWDISKGIKKDPLVTYRHSVTFPKDDHFGDFTVDTILKIRELFPNDRPEMPEGILIASTQQEVDQLVAEGSFPDIIVATGDVTGPAYITLTRRGILQEPLPGFDALLIFNASSYVRDYSEEEAQAVRYFVAEGGKAVVTGENFWSARANTFPIMQQSGVSFTMQLTALVGEFAADSPLVGGFQRMLFQAGSGLCIGEAPGWNLDYEGVRRVLDFSNGEYQMRLRTWQLTYRDLPQEELCVEQEQDGVYPIAWSMHQRDGGNLEPTRAVSVIRANVGSGSALLFADNSWLVNGRLDFAISNGYQNLQFIHNLVDFYIDR